MPTTMAVITDVRVATHTTTTTTPTLEDGNATLVGASDAIAEPRARPAGVVPRGALIGRYVVLGVAGRGAMGVVYQAYDPELHREVAIKLLRGEGGELADARMRREAQAMASVSHPNVLPVHDVGTFEGRVWIAMEFLAAQTLTEWLDHRPRRGWREVTDLFVQAGRGLAAAHAVGLVHRDFKPDNVLVGADGRARVMDFGLARTASFDGDAAGDGGAPPSDGGDPDLTAAGSVVGTPRYMAPEQHEGEATDGRADQFAFGAALFEALYGVRAFTGDSIPELAARKHGQRLGAVDPGLGVPAWIHRIVLRCLEPDPVRRFATMDDVLVALADDPGARRRRRMWWGGGAALCTVAIVGPLVWVADSRACRDADRKLVGVWDDERREQVAASMRATGVVYAEDSHARVRALLDTHVAQWLAAHQAACEATHVHHEQSPELLDARMVCLERARAELGALVEVLAHADATVVERSVTAATELRPASDCDASPELLAVARAPTDPEAVAAIAQVEGAIARGAALVAAGKAAEAVAVLEAATTEARAIGFVPLVARALRTLSDAIYYDGHAARARAVSVEALGLALGANDRPTATALLVDLVFIDGADAGHAASAHQWARVAEGLLASLPDERMSTSLLNAEAVAYFTAGEVSVGLTLAEQALARERAVDPVGLRLATLTGNLGAALVIAGRADEGAPYLREALAIKTEVLGREHPLTMQSDSNLAAFEMLHGDVPGAIARLEALAIAQERALGGDHPNLGHTLNNLGNAYRRDGQYDRAIATHRRCLALRERNLGPNAPILVQSLDNLAIALRGDGQLAEARAALDRAAALRRASLAPGHADFASSELGDAMQSQAEGDLPRALAAATRAVQMRDEQPGDSPTAAIGARLVLGEILAEMGDRAAAVVALRRVIDDAKGNGAADAYAGRASFALARSVEDSTRAVALARSARATLVRVHDLELVPAIDAWLAAHDR